MFRLFDFLGRSAAIVALDDALRASGVHPMLVPDAVKHVVVRLQTEDIRPPAEFFADAAELLAFCILGSEAFRETNGDLRAEAMDARFEDATLEGDSLDAKLILITVHAGLICPEIADRVDVEDA